MDKIFPDTLTENRVICVPGPGSKTQFSVLITNKLVDLNLNSAGAQCFPRYQYKERRDASAVIPCIEHEAECIDNIPNRALENFRQHYMDESITKDAIFAYVYGVLHAPIYRIQYANNLSKELPRIPFASNFHTFATAGNELAELHLGYETCEQFPLSFVFTHKGEPKPHHFRLSERPMRLVGDAKDTLIINEHVRLTGIPAAAHQYVVNGRTPLEWFVARYKIKRDKKSGIVNDPNGWFADPRDLVAAIQRIVHVSVESTRIIESLPSELTVE